MKAEQERLEMLRMAQEAARKNGERLAAIAKAKAAAEQASEEAA